MDAAAGKEPVTRTALEDFLRDYVETIGGAWDEVEPQVYDLLLPACDSAQQEGADPVVARVTFDPEALPEHPGAQLASFGTPFVNGLLTDAIERGRATELYLVGLNLAPHDFAARIRRTFRFRRGSIQPDGRKVRVFGRTARVGYRLTRAAQRRASSDAARPHIRTPRRRANRTGQRSRFRFGLNNS